VRKAKKLGGKGKLTETLIKKLSTYYSLAIRRNVNSAQDMKKAIMATFYHMISTDENPRHENCPTGSDNWCQWQQATTLGNAPEPHLTLNHYTTMCRRNYYQFTKIFQEMTC